MKGKTKIIGLSVILGILVVLFLIGMLTQHRNSFKNLYQLPLVDEIPESEIGEIVLETGNSSITLSRSGNDWVVNIGGTIYPADKQKITNLIDKITGITTRRLVSEDPKIREELAIDEKQIKILDREGDTIAHIMIGGGEEGEEEFVMTGSTGNKIFTVNSTIGFYTEQDQVYWSELSLFRGAIQREGVIKIDIAADRLQFSDETAPVEFELSLLKQTGENGAIVWKTIQNNELVDTNTVDSILSAFSTIRGDRFISAVESGGIMREETGRITLSNENGEYRLEVIGRIDEDTFACGTNINDYLYAVKTWSLERIFNDIRK